jgi:fido (protein-threonine AMPylation protein)
MTMPDGINWKLELDEYIQHGDPDKVQKSLIWQTAIGLQDVDGLKVSGYLLQTAKEHIEGKIDIAQAEERILEYYNQIRDSEDFQNEAMEADIVSIRIVDILNRNAFQLSPAKLQNIHGQLFYRVFDHAGKYRLCNISKKEWVLNGDTVFYIPFTEIQKTLEYDIEQEKHFSYASISAAEAVEHIASFASGLWQIHPFAEGNTRTMAVFVIQYLKTFGLQIQNDVFAQNSWYFRNALVRANYTNLEKEISPAQEYLDRFFENMILGSAHLLNNQDLHIDCKKKGPAQRPVFKKLLLSNCTLEELGLLQVIARKPDITQKDMAEQTGKPVRTVKARITSLQEKGLICREGGKRNGFWKLLIYID